MAEKKKASPGGKKPRNGSPPEPAPEDLIIDAALSLAASRGWRALHLYDIAQEAGLPLTQVRSLYRRKDKILSAFIRRIDEYALGSAPDAEGTTRDRLFDLLMRRFDALAPYKAGITAIIAESRRYPCPMLRRGPALLRSMRRTLQAAGVTVSGVRGLARTQALALLYLATLRVWLNDHSEDMSKTMASLDKRLRFAEKLECRCHCVCGPQPRREAA